MYNYAEYLYDLNSKLVKKEKINEEEIEKRRSKNSRLEEKLIGEARVFLDPKKWKEKDQW